jgi:phosphoglycolate phosphatase-like HAD superfamily hydrolase
VVVATNQQGVALAAAPEHALVVGDAHRDFEAGSAAGVRSILAPYPG